MADYSIEVSIPNVGPQGPQGEVGPVGPANELTLGEIATGDAGTEAEATISGTPPNQVLDLVLPRGDTGAQGNPGPTGAGGIGVVPAPIYATMQEAVEDGITFGGVFRHTSGSVFWVEEPDPDAATFVAASGATDVWNIQKFVQGVKALGLWDDMVCWPLRSTQNAGTGTTAYSLGGRGTYNGTLINSPTWGANGLTNSATGGVRAAVPFATTHSGLVVYKQSSTSGLQTPLMFGDATLGNANERRTNFRTDTNWFGWNGTTFINHAFGPSSLDAFRMAGYGIVSASTLLGYNNGVTTTVNSSTADISGGTPAANVGLMAAISTSSNVQNMVGVMAFGAAFDVQLSSGQHSDFYNLYKSTLGIGLSLP